MNKSKTKLLRDSLIGAIITVGVLYILSAILSPLIEILLILWEKLFGKITATLALKILVSQYILILILSALLIYLIIRLFIIKNRRKTYRFNIFWDRKNNPRCPYCGSKFKKQDEGPVCSKCGRKSIVGEVSENNAYPRWEFTKYDMNEAIDIMKNSEEEKKIYSDP